MNRQLIADFCIKFSVGAAIMIGFLALMSVAAIIDG